MKRSQYNEYKNSSILWYNFFYYYKINYFFINIFSILYQNLSTYGVIQQWCYNLFSEMSLKDFIWIKKNLVYNFILKKYWWKFDIFCFEVENKLNAYQMRMQDCPVNENKKKVKNFWLKILKKTDITGMIWKVLSE